MNSQEEIQERITFLEDQLDSLITTYLKPTSS
jgi:hypothetical protein